MKLSQTQANVVRKALNQWREEGALNSDEAKKLDESIEIERFDWQGLSTYTLYAALGCFVIAIAAIFKGDVFYQLLQRLMQASDSLYAFLFTALSIILLVLGRHFRFTALKANTEVVQILIVTCWGIALFFWNKVFGWNDRHVGFLILCWSLPAFGLALIFESVLQWVMGFIALAIAFITIADKLADSNAFVAQFNYVFRATICFGALLGASWFMQKMPRLKPFYNITANISLFMLLLSFWALSITGNSTGYEQWRALSSVHFLPWHLLYAIVAGIVLWQGFRKDNDLLQAMGFLSFFLNIYTLYFEFGWNAMHKALFFAILAVSLWLVSRKAEQIARKKGKESNKLFNFSSMFKSKKEEEL
jgi:uncharacterized membrane protein